MADQLFAVVVERFACLVVDGGEEDVATPLLLSMLLSSLTWLLSSV